LLPSSVSPGFFLGLATPALNALARLASNAFAGKEERDSRWVTGYHLSNPVDVTSDSRGPARGRLVCYSSNNPLSDCALVSNGCHPPSSIRAASRGRHDREQN